MGFDYLNDGNICLGSQIFQADKLRKHRDKYMADEAKYLNNMLEGIEKYSDAEKIYRERRHRLPMHLRRFAPELRAASSGYYSHSAFFRGIGEADREDIEALIRDSFSSRECFYYHFRHSAEISYGSGFLWLIRRRGRARLWFAPAGTLPPAAYEHIMALDLWEHAWIDSFESRADYAMAYIRSCGLK